MSSSLTLNYNSITELFFEFHTLQWLMSVKLNCPPKPETSQKYLNFNGKTIPYPGFEPGNSGLAVGSLNHYTIGSV
jgi:hypothetical protein